MDQTQEDTGHVFPLNHSQGHSCLGLQKVNCSKLMNSTKVTMQIDW